MRTYTKDEKQEVIDRYMSGEMPVSIVEDLGIPKSTLYSWLRAYHENQNVTEEKAITVRNFRVLENKVERLEGLLKY